jgi:DNA invertase Pin-like site-specific DNA recombinase
MMPFFSPISTSALSPAGYVRRSSPLQATNFSLEAQKRGIAEECIKRGLPPPVFYVDDERSARGEQVAQRPAFQQLLQDVQAGRVQVVMVHTFDRWSRNVLVTLQSFRILAENQAAFISISEHIDYLSPEGRLQLTILAAFAAFFSEMLATHVRKGKQQRAYEGLPNGQVPYGYRSTGPKTPPELDPHAFAGLCLIGEARMQGHSASQIAEAANAAGYRISSPRLGERPFTTPTINAILSNAFYAAFAPGETCGTIVSQGQRFRGQHQAAFTFEEWTRIHEGAQRNYRAPHRAARAHLYVFSGTVVCAHCGMLLRVNGNGETKYVYYRDTAAQRHLDCPVQGSRHMRQDRLLVQFGTFLQGLRLPEGWQERLRQQILEATPTAKAEQEGWEQEYARLMQKRQRTLRQHREGYISDEECAGEVAAVELALRHLHHQETKQMLEESLALGERLPEIIAGWFQAAREEQRAWVQLLVEPAGMAIDLETQQIAAFAPRPALLPLLRLRESAEMGKRPAGLVLLAGWQPFTQQLGPRSLFRMLFPERFEQENEAASLEALRQELLSLREMSPGSEVNPNRGRIPASQWLSLLEQLERGASRRQLAQAYGISYAALRRTEQRARKALHRPVYGPASRWKIPEAAWETLLRRMEQGASLAHLAQEYQVSASTVRRTAQVAREKLQQPAQQVQMPGKIAQTEWAGMLARLDRGETQAQVAHSYHVSARTIRRIETLARAQGIALPRLSSRRWRIPPVEWPTLLARIQEGVSRKQIAEIYGVSLPTLRKVYQAACTTLQAQQPLLVKEQMFSQ